MPLRPYQSEAIQAVKQHLEKGINKQLVVLPTGVGKAVIAANLPEALALPGQMVFLAHKIELVDQAARQLSKFNPGLRISIDRADQIADLTGDVIVSSIPTIGRPNKNDPEGFSPRLRRYNNEQVFCIQQDESHHLAIDNDMFVNPLRYFRVFKGEPEHCDPHKLLVAYTATPSRADGIGLESIFDAIVYSRDIRDMIAEKWLVDIRGYHVETTVSLEGVKSSYGDFQIGSLERRVNTQERNRLIVDKYRELGRSRPAIAFTVDVAHSHDLASEFRRAGISALPISGLTPEDERKRMIESHRTRTTAVLTSCSVLSEGADLPWAEIGLMARPTRSGLLYRQCIGRLLRPFPAPEDGPPIKTSCTILDFCDLSIRHQLITMPTLFGLNPRVDLGGESLTEVLREADTASEQLRLDSVTSLGELRSMIQAVNLLEPPKLSETALKYSHYAWLESPLGFQLAIPGSILLGIRENALGFYDVVEYRNGLKVNICDNIRNLKDALNIADRHIPDDSRRLLRADAGWRSDPPSHKQIVALSRLDKSLYKVFGNNMTRFSDFICANYSKGKLSAVLSELIDRHQENIQ